MSGIRAWLLLLVLAPVSCLAVAADTEPNPVVEGIECNGNVTVSCERIRTQTGITIDKELDEVQVEKARLRLETLPNFRAVQIHLIKGSQKHRVVVVIDVTEADPITTAFAAGTLLQPGDGEAQIETFAARITDHNLFGSGKVLDFAIVAGVPIAAGGGEQYAARLEYLDPQLFDSKRYFLAAGAFYSKSSFNFSQPPYVLAAGSGYQNAGEGIDLSLGMHLDTYSYVTLGYRYLQRTSSNDQFLTSDGAITSLSSSPGSVILFSVGRNTEDDASFPTHGWLLHAYDGYSPKAGADFAGVVVRGTWRAGEDAFWTFQARPFDDFRSLFDDDLGVSISYSHNLFGDSPSGSIHRARWYVGPGFTELGHAFTSQKFEVGAKAGVRLETKYFGTVNLYVIATHLVHGGL